MLSVRVLAAALCFSRRLNRGGGVGGSGCEGRSLGTSLGVAPEELSRFLEVAVVLVFVRRTPCSFFVVLGVTHPLPKNEWAVVGRWDDLSLIPAVTR